MEIRVTVLGSRNNKSDNKRCSINSDNKTVCNVLSCNFL